MRYTFRSIGAILAGIVVLTVVSFAIEAAADPLLMHLFPRALPDATALKNSVAAHTVMFAYTFLSVMAGGYVTAWISRLSPVRDAVIMGAMEVLLTAWAMHAFPHQAPLYSWIVGMIFCIPAAWLGGVLRVRATKPKAIAQPA